MRGAAFASFSTRSRRASPVAELVRHYPIRSLNVIADIRKATQGPVGLENTHPFMRELWGRYWIFAHNGTDDYALAFDGSVLPVGQTDSELAFCHPLQTLRQRFPGGAPERSALRDALEDFAAQVRPHGTFNFLLSNGDCLFAQRSTQSLHCPPAVCRRSPQGPGRRGRFQRAGLAGRSYVLIATLPSPATKHGRCCRSVALLFADKYTTLPDLGWPLDFIGNTASALGLMINVFVPVAML